MKPAHPTARELFSACLDLPAPKDRQALLDEIARRSPEIAEEAGELLRAHEDAEKGNFIQANPCPSDSDDEAETVMPLVESTESEIDRYKLLKKLGEGGMGEVWLAEQTRPVRRRVALKIVKLGMDTKQVLARFDAERQALALMNHPNIAQAIDGGATKTGRPYFVMEWIKGEPITTFCDRFKLDINSRLQLFIKVCGAIQHAHQKGVIHRDIKASNVLVTMQEDIPIPKVIDFGIAKAISQQLTEETLFTESGQLIGTPYAMSPEQMEQGVVDIDTRADVYSLGVLLYELLTGSAPFDKTLLRRAAYAEICRIIREDAPLKPSTRISTVKDIGPEILSARATEVKKLVRFMRGDLDWVVMKALEKDRSRRYASAAEFGADVERFLNHRPVVAVAPSVAYLMGKFVIRNRALVAGLCIVAASLVSGLVLALFGLEEARWQTQVAEQNAAHGREVAEILGEMIAYVNPSDHEEKLTLEDLLGRLLEKTEDRLSTQPEVAVEIWKKIADSCYGLSKLPEAVDLYQRARAKAVEHFGASHLETARISAILGPLSDDPGEAWNLLTNAFEVYRAEYGEDAMFTLEVKLSMAFWHLEYGDRHEAVACYEQMLRHCREHAGEREYDDGRGWALTDLFRAHTRIKEYEQALIFAREAHELYSAYRHATDHKTLRAHRDYAKAILNLERPDEAIVILKELRDLQTTKYGKNHVEIAETEFLLGFSHRSRGDHASSVQHFEQAHQIFADRLGEDTRDTLDAHCELIKAYEAQSLGDKAARLRRRYLDIFEKHVTRLGEDPDEEVFRNLSWIQGFFHQAFGGSDPDARDMTRRLERLCAQYGREPERMR